MRRRRRWVHSAAIRVSTSASWLGPVGWNSRRKAAVRASSAAGSSPGMMWDTACMPDFMALREEAALPSGEAGPVDFWEFRRFALICAWEDMLEPRLGSGDAECAWRGPVLLSAKHEGAGIPAGHGADVIDGMGDGNFERAVIARAARKAGGLKSGAANAGHISASQKAVWGQV